MGSTVTNLLSSRTQNNSLGTQAKRSGKNISAVVEQNGAHVGAPLHDTGSTSTAITPPPPLLPFRPLFLVLLLVSSTLGQEISLPLSVHKVSRDVLKCFLTNFVFEEILLEREPSGPYLRFSVLKQETRWQRIFQDLHWR